MDIIVLDMPILDTRQGRDLIGTFLSDVVLALLSYVAQSERETLRKRQREGIDAAKLRGTHLGRPKQKLPSNFTTVVKRWECKQITLQEAIVATGLKQSTFFNKLRELRFTNRMQN